jgi:integrase
VAYAEKRKNGWRARWLQPDGRYGSKDGFATKREAKEYGESQEAEIRAGRWIDPKLAETPLGEWWNEWFPAQDLAPNTLESYAQQWRKHIGPRWGSVALNAIRNIDIERWIKGLREVNQLSASTITIITSALRRALEDAAVNGMIARSPMPPRRPRRSQRRGPAASRPRQGIVIPIPVVETILGRLPGEAERLIVLIALTSGMRWSEVAGMRLDYLTLRPPGQDGSPASGHYLIDPQVGALHEDVHSRPYFGPPKSGSADSLGPGYQPGRVIDLPPFLALLLLAYTATLRKTELGLLFPSVRKAKPRSYDGWNTGRWRPACDGRPASVSAKGHSLREAVPPVWPGMPLRFHDLKHTAKAIMNNLRIHPAMQDYRLGHTTPGVPGVYSHPTDEMRRELINALQTFWEKWIIDGLQDDWAAQWRSLTSSPKFLPSGL